MTITEILLGILFVLFGIAAFVAVPATFIL